MSVTVISWNVSAVNKLVEVPEGELRWSVLLNETKPFVHLNITKEEIDSVQNALHALVNVKVQKYKRSEEYNVWDYLNYKGNTAARGAMFMTLHLGPERWIALWNAPKIRMFYLLTNLIHSVGVLQGDPTIGDSKFIFPGMTTTSEGGTLGNRSQDVFAFRLRRLDMKDWHSRNLLDVWRITCEREIEAMEYYPLINLLSRTALLEYLGTDAFIFDEEGGKHYFALRRSQRFYDNLIKAIQRAVLSLLGGARVNYIYLANDGPIVDRQTYDDIPKRFPEIFINGIDIVKADM